MSAMLHAVVHFFVVFSLCLKLLLSWLWLLGDLCLLVHPLNSYHGPLLDGASSNIRSAWGGSATTTDTKTLCRCCWPCNCAAAAASISDASSGLYQLCYGSSTGGFLFQSWASHHFVFYVFGVCSGVCFLLSGAMLDAIFTIGVCTVPTFWSRHMCNLVMVISPQWLLPLLLWVGGASCYSISALQPFQLYSGAYSFGGIAGSNPILPPSLHGCKRSSVPGLVPTNDTVDSESAVGIKPGDSDAVIWYQADEVTCTWSVEWCVAYSHIYPGFTDKVSWLTHFPLEPGCEDYSFLDQAVADFEQGLDSIVTDSIKTPELDTSLDEPYTITSSVSFGFLCSVSTISDTSKLQLVARIGCHKLWYQARALLAPVPLATNMSASVNLYATSLVTLQPLDSGLLHHQITSPWLLPTGRLIRVYQNFRVALMLLLMPFSTWNS